MSKVDNTYILAFGWDADVPWWISVCQDLRIPRILIDPDQIDTTDPQPETPKYAATVAQYNAAGIAVGLESLSYLLALDSEYLSDADMIYGGDVENPILSHNGALNLYVPSIAALPTLAANVAEFYTSNGLTAGLHFDGFESLWYLTGNQDDATDYADALIGIIGAQPIMTFSSYTAYLRDTYSTAWGGRDTPNLNNTTFDAHLAEHVAAASQAPTYNQPANMGWMAFWSAAQHAYTLKNWWDYFDAVRSLDAAFNLEMSYNPTFFTANSAIRAVIANRGKVGLGSRRRAVAGASL